MDHDLGFARLHPLAGAQVKGRAVPTPIGDLQLHRDEAFRAAGGVLDIIEIGWLGACLILAAHDMLERHGLQSTDHFELFVAHGVGLEPRGWLHRGQAQELHEMVLHHVPHRPGFVVIGPAAAHAHFFGDRDLHMIDILRIPQRLEQRIAETHRHQVLDGLFAQVVVDAVNLCLVEMRGQRRVERARGLAVTSKGFFNNDPSVLARDVEVMQSLGQRPEQAGRDREIKGLHHIGAHHLG